MGSLKISSSDLKKKNFLYSCVTSNDNTKDLHSTIRVNKLHYSLKKKMPGTKNKIMICHVESDLFEKFSRKTEGSI